MINYHLRIPYFGEAWFNDVDGSFVANLGHLPVQLEGQLEGQTVYVGKNSMPNVCLIGQI